MHAHVLHEGPVHALYHEHLQLLVGPHRVAIREYVAGRSRDALAVFHLAETSFTLKRQKPMQEPPATKEDPIYLSIFDWC